MHHQATPDIRAGLSPFLAVVALSVAGLFATGHAWPLLALSPVAWSLTLVPVAAFAGAGFILRRHRPVAWDRIGWVVTAVVGCKVLLMAAISWKLAIPTWHGFAWDPTLAQWDTWLHGGVTPDRWLTPLLDSPGAMRTLDTFYSRSWFVAFAGVTLWAAWRKDGRYLLAMGLVWVLLGALTASLFASAGPVYYAMLGHGDLYRPLTDRLHLAPRAFAWHHTLWRAYQGEPTGVVAGISAFPSIHVAMPALYLCAAWRVGWARHLAGWFLLLTLIGSVVLGWHYAVDGYAGILGAVGCWWLAGKFV